MILKITKKIRGKIDISIKIENMENISKKSQ